MNIYAYDFMNNTEFSIELGPNLSWSNTSFIYKQKDTTLENIAQPGIAFNIKAKYLLTQSLNMQSKIGIETFNAKDENKLMIVDENNDFERYMKLTNQYSLTQFNLDLKVNYQMISHLEIGIGGYCSFPVSELKFKYDYERSNGHFKVHHSDLNRPLAGISGELTYNMNRFYTTLEYKYGLNHMVLHGESIGFFYEHKPSTVRLLLGYKINKW